MANQIDEELKLAICQAYTETGSIRATTRISRCSRNTVRRILREEGLGLRSLDISSREGIKPQMTEWDFQFLEELLSKAEGSKESQDFKEQIKELANKLSVELGVNSKVDELRLENALFQYIIYRRFYMTSLKTSDRRYEGPFTRSHEKQAKAVLAWVDASHKALEMFNRIIRELEVKNGRRDVRPRGSLNLVVSQRQVNISR